MQREDLSEDILAILEADPTKRELRTVGQLDYYNRTYKGSSYSRSEMLRTCPRKFELMSKFRLFPRRESVTFAYGHAVGAGVQAVLAGSNFDRAVLAVLFNYDYPIDQMGTYNESMANKSYWHAVKYIEKFYYLYHNGLLPALQGWEIAKFKDGQGNEVSGVELTFVVDLGDGYTYEGHIDLVMYHPLKNKYMVIELKTNGGFNVQELSYKNSAQGLGYSCIIDMIAGDLKASSSFDVLYIVAKSRTMEFLPFVFTKTPAMKSEWILTVLTEKATVDMYEAQGFYPKFGGSCLHFQRPCDVIDFCNRPNEELRILEQNAATQDTVLYTSMDKPMFFFHITQLIDRQEKLEQYTKHGNLTDLDLLLNAKTVG